MPEAKHAETMQETAARLRWTAVIAGFFIIQAVIWAVAIVLTNNDSSHAVVPDYDQKGQAWNETAAERRASEKLGWTANIAVDPEEDSLGLRAIRIGLKDRQQQPIDSADMEITLFHRAHAARAETLHAEQDNSGRYAIKARMKSDGLWQFRLRAKRGSDVFWHEETQQLNGLNKSGKAG